MASCYPNASSNALWQQHIWHAAAKGYENNKKKKKRENEGQFYEGCYAPQALGGLLPSKISDFSLKSSKRKVVSCIFCSACAK